uniref:Uncharacterized protein n=1 Tax=Solibacter usitatus (strain Ellin6076) TaxID=234267 RepID=Q01P89_SOLUE
MFRLMLSVAFWASFALLAQQQPVPPDSFPDNASGAFQVSGAFRIGTLPNEYFSTVNITNAGTEGPHRSLDMKTSGNMCVNIYVFDPDENMAACCSCGVTPNGLKTLNVEDLLSNAYASNQPRSTADRFTVKLWATLPQNYPAPPGNILCNPGFPGPCQTPSASSGCSALGMRAWMTTIYPNGVTEKRFEKAVLVGDERDSLTTTCSQNFPNSRIGGCQICRRAGGATQGGGVFCSPLCPGTN